MKLRRRDFVRFSAVGVASFISVPTWAQPSGTVDSLPAPRVILTGGNVDLEPMFQAMKAKCGIG